MERRGFEPLTLTLPVSRATNCANAPCNWNVIGLSIFRGGRSPPSNLIKYQICGYPANAPYNGLYFVVNFYGLAQLLQNRCLIKIAGSLLLPPCNDFDIKLSFWGTVSPLMSC